MRRNKYGVSPREERTYNGRTYASKAECEYAKQLYILRKGGNIIEFIEQPRVWLGVPENVYYPDFLIVSGISPSYFIDVKGVETPKFRHIKKLWEKYGHLNLHVVKKSGNRFKTTEIIKGNKGE